jgi:outer membrane lipoprotein carrier protein
MRRILSACMLCAGLGAVFCRQGLTLIAAAAPTTENSSKEVQTLVRLLETRYHSATSWKATFLERYSEGPREMRLESGTAYFRKPGRMRWEYEEPEKKLFVADGKTVWFYVPADKTVTRAAMKESDDWRTPLALLTGKAKLDRLCGKIELLAAPAGQAGRPTEAVARDGTQTLRCLPKDKFANASRPPSQRDASAIESSAPFTEILFQVNRATGELSDIIIRQSGGTEMEYRFGNWQRDISLPDSMFRFQAPPGVAIVEETSGTRPGI